MDAPSADPRQLERSLAYIRRINQLLGYTRATLYYLDIFSRGWKPGETIRLLDVATGSGDIPRAVLRWGEKRGFDLRIVGMDLSAITARAAAAGGHSSLRIVQADASRLPFEDNSFDYAMTSMFLHHLETDAAAAVMAAMGRVARRGVIISDLLRHRRALGWITLFTLLANPMVRHDARLSVAQAYTEQEVLRLRDRAGLGFAGYHQHFGHRFVLAGEKAVAHLRTRTRETAEPQAASVPSPGTGGQSSS